MNEKAYPQVPTQSPIQRKEPIVKTTLRTVLTALTLFALLTTAFANGDPDPLEGLVFNVAGNYYDGYITAARLAVTGSSPVIIPPGPQASCWPSRRPTTAATSRLLSRPSPKLSRARK